MKIIRTALALVVAALAVSVVSAQSGGLTVQVVDANGPLPGATVTISHETGFVKTTSSLTTADGLAVFPVLRPGRGYTVEVSFPGFGTRRVSDLHVRLSQSETVTVQLAEEFQERVKVTAEGEVVDLEKTAQTTKFSDEFIQDLPVPGRFYQNVLTLAPGVQDADGDGNPNVHGGRDRDFKAVVSGVSNVDPLTGQQMSNVNPNSIEEMEVITAGASVEFSRAQAGFARIIQKQGSNEFEGVFEFYFRSSLLDGDGATDFDATDEPDYDWFQPSIQVSGPIIKDKLWYRLSHEWINQELPVNTGSSNVVATRERGVHSDQLTWQVSPRNKLALQFQSDPDVFSGLGVSNVTPLESSLTRERTGETWTLTWTAPYSPKLLVESRVSWQDLNLALRPTAEGVPNDCIDNNEFLQSAQCFSGTTNLTSGSYFQTWNDHRQRLTVGGDATLYGGRFWGMNHQFKFGAVAENERYFRELERRPDISVFQFTGIDPDNPSEADPRVLIAANVAVPQKASVNANGTVWGVYFEDQMKPRQNLTITFGLRLDREEVNTNGHEVLDLQGESDEFWRLVDRRGELALDEGLAAAQTFTAFEGTSDFIFQLEDTVGVPAEEIYATAPNSIRQSAINWDSERGKQDLNITNNNLSPLLSVSWDPWSNGKTKIAATARRYYSNMFLDIPLREVDATRTTIVYSARSTADGTIVGEPEIDDGVNPAATVTAVSRDLKTPHNDEWTIGFEREIAPETSVGVTYVNRKFRNQYQDIDLNHKPQDWGVCNPTTGVANSYSDPSDTDPGDGVIDDCQGEIIVPFGEDATSSQRPDGIDDLYLQNPGWGDYYLIGNFNSTDYQAFVLALTRRQYRSWELQASYTWSEAIGDGEDYAQALGDDASLLDDERGFQSYDQRHVVKVNATTITPWGFRLGGAVTWQSGLPFSLITRSLSFDPVPPHIGNLGNVSQAQVRDQYSTGQRNTERNDSYWNVDLKFSKEMNIGRGLNMQISAEVFNLLNDGTYFIFNPRTRTGQQVNGNNIGYFNFGRSWQLGLKLAF
jgi:hypothetical protein